MIQCDLKIIPRVVDEPCADNYTSKEVMHNIGSWIQNGTTWT